MRWLTILAAFAALTWAQTASAAPVSISEVAISPQFERVLQRKLGTREGPMLQHMVYQAVSRALRRAGADVQPGAPVTIETTIVDAYPNQPTMKQLEDTPGLSMIDSISIGGAELHAVIRSRDGRVLAEVHHRRYSNSIADVIPYVGQWFDADRAIQQFARKVARAYLEHAAG